MLSAVGPTRIPSIGGVLVCGSVTDYVLVSLLMKLLFYQELTSIVICSRIYCVEHGEIGQTLTAIGVKVNSVRFGDIANNACLKQDVSFSI